MHIYIYHTLHGHYLLLNTMQLCPAGNDAGICTLNACWMPLLAKPQHLMHWLTLPCPTCCTSSPLPAAIPPGNCLNVSMHCPNDIDNLCDKTDLNKKWCTCWGGVTECVTLGVCKYTPCKTCQVCLSWAALQTPQLFNLTNAGLVAAEVNTRCKAWGKTSATCQGAADSVALSEVGNSGKRGGKLCSLLNECVNPAGMY